MWRQTTFFISFPFFPSHSSIQSISSSHHFTKPVSSRLRISFILTPQNTLYVTECTTVFIPVSDNFIHCLFFFRAFTIIFTFTFHFHALEKEMATHSSVLAWRIPGTGEPDGLPSMGSHRVGHDWSDLAASAAATHIWTLTIFVL